MPQYIIPSRYKVRGFTAEEIASRNEVLLEREQLFETDTGRAKLGDGETPTNDRLHTGWGFADLTDLADGQVMAYDDTLGYFLPTDLPATYTDEQARDAIAAMIAAGTHSNISFSYNDAGDALSATVSAAYTDEMAQDAVASMIAAGTHTGISFSYDDANNKISATVSGGSGGYGATGHKFKTSDTARTSNNTLSDDPHLASVALAASSAYRVRLNFHWETTTATPGFKYAVAYSGSVTSVRGGTELYIPGTTEGFSAEYQLLFTALPTGALSQQGHGRVSMEFTIVTNTAGNLSLQWAQNTSSASATTMFRGAELVVDPVA